ncbi:MAG: prepilin-type N-terminal cleavage/methylation domain-containing protein, partial [Sulfolobaceae archaeon]
MIRKEKSGFTLIEILVTLFITMIALSIAYFTYIKILKGSLFQSSVGKSQIESLMGTSLLQFDVEMAGYGIPSSVGDINYQEASNGTAQNYNDSPSNPPRPIIIANNSNPPSSYLVIKSAIADINSTSQKWTNLYYDTNLNQWELQYNNWIDPSSHFSQNSSGYCILLDAQNKALYSNEGTYAFPFNSLPSAVSNSLNTNTMYLVYGINNGPIRMPFNRVDYYLSSTGLGSSCDPNTYVLYRATVNQTNGTLDPKPLLNCVKDFRATALINGQWYSDTTNLSLSQIQNTQLVKIFILQQSSKYSNQVISTSTLTLGDSSTGTLSTFTPSGLDSHYQWK